MCKYLALAITSAFLLLCLATLAVFGWRQVFGVREFVVPCSPIALADVRSPDADNAYTCVIVTGKTVETGDTPDHAGRMLFKLENEGEGALVAWSGGQQTAPPPGLVVQVSGVVVGIQDTWIVWAIRWQPATGRP